MLKFDQIYNYYISNITALFQVPEVDGRLFKVWVLQSGGRVEKQDLQLSRRPQQSNFLWRRRSHAVQVASWQLVL